MIPPRKGIDPGRVAIYIRWSTDDQGEGTTLEVQLEGCRHYALSQGWAVRDDLIFIDDGQSGGSLDRPALNRLRALVMGGEVDCVVVFKMDRLSRSVLDMVKLVLEEWDGRCHVKSSREALDTASSQGKMFFYLLSSFAEWERATIRDRTYAGRLRRAQEGRSPGYVYPLGFRPGPETGTVVPVESEVEIVRRIYREYAAGAGMPQIARRLNAEGAYGRRGKPWIHATVRYVLTNPAYKGDLVYGLRWDNPQRKPGEKSRYYRNVPLLVNRGFYPAIVEPELWERVQGVRASRPQPTRRESGRAFASPYLLSGLLRCRCGAAMVSRRSRQGRGVAYYCCTAAMNQGTCACGYIRQDCLDATVVGKLCSLHEGAAVTEPWLQVLAVERERDRRGLENQLAAVSRKVARLEERMDEVRRQYRDGVLSLDEFRGIGASTEREAAALTRQRQALERGIRAAPAAALDSLEPARLADLDRWAVLEPQQRKTLVRQFVSKVTAYRDEQGVIRCEVEWRVKGH